MGATAAISGAQFASGVIQAESIRAEGSFRKSTADANARLLDLRAEDEIRRGEKDATEYKKRVRKLRGAQRAAYGASGVDVNTGSAMLVQQETEEQGSLDALTIKNNAWKAAWGLKQEAFNTRMEGEYAQIGAKGSAARTYATAGLDAFRTAYPAAKAYIDQKRADEKKKKGG